MTPTIHDNRPVIAAAQLLLNEVYKPREGTCWCMGPHYGEPLCPCRMEDIIRARLQQLTRMVPLADERDDPFYRPPQAVV